VSGDDDRREPDQIAGVPLPEEQPVLVGHDVAHDGIIARMQAGRLPNAALLHGPRGIGKATLAFRLAREILAATGDEDAHRVDEQVIAGSHPNLFVLRRKPKDTRGFYTVIRVDDVREVKQRLRTTRGRAGFRLVVVDAIDDCNPSAANALLKILEEPPADTFFLLVSHRPGALLPTIRSRCADLPLRPLSDIQVRAVLEANMPGEGEDKLNAAVALAGGRPRRAFEALTVAGDGTLAALRNWLAAPLDFPAGAHLALADALAGDSAESGFGREMLMDWVAREARDAALAGAEGRMRLASAGELWEKAQALLAETDELNLDLRETLVEILDAIRRHLTDTAAVFQ